jgi:hypothetical protein
LDIQEADGSLTLAEARWVHRVVAIEVDVVTGGGGTVEQTLDGQGASRAGDTGQDRIILEAIGTGVRVERIVGGNTMAVFSRSAE